MKISLNKANRLRNQLEALKFERKTTVTLRTNQSVNEAKKLLSQGKYEYLNYTKTSLKKISVLYKLRGLVNQTNHKIGLNDLIGEIAMTEALIRFVSGIDNEPMYQRNFPKDFDDFEAEVSYREVVKEPPAPSRMEVTVISEDILEDQQKTLQDLRLKSTELQEERNKLNHSNTIELPEDVVEFLREHKLI